MHLGAAKDKFARIVSHNGRVIVFSSRMDAGSGVNRIGYTTLQPSAENPDQDAAWKDYTFLSFPHELRTVCRSVITIDFKSADVPVADVPFDVVSDGRYVYVFRQSNNATLYVDRFVYDEGSERLINTWEVRFRRSRKQDIPLDRKDTFGSTDMNGKRFIEATIELDFVTNVANGRFAVLIVPTELVGVDRWQIFAEDTSDGRLNSFSIARSTDGLFDLADVIDEEGNVPPDRRFQLKSPSGDILALQSGCDAALYNQQEWQIDAYGVTTLQKRETRVMLALAAGAARHVAIVDFAVGKDGFLAQGPDELVVTSLPVIGTALAFTRDAATSVDIPDLSAGTEVTVEAWIYPGDYSSDTDHIVQGAANLKAPFALRLEGGIPSFECAGATAMGDTALSVHGWTHLAGVYTSDGPVLYVNGEPFTADDSYPRSAAKATSEAGYRFGGPEGFTGLLDEVRLWNVARTADEILSTMCTSVNSASPGWDKLLGYWKMDEPDDGTRLTTVANSSSLGAAANGTLMGPRWASTSAPVGVSMAPIAWDSNGLTVASAELAWCSTSVAPVLYEGADSNVHMYYLDDADQWALAAHYSVIVSRASYTLPWSAPDPLNPDNDESGIISFVARQAGSSMNNPRTSPSYVKVQPIKDDAKHAKVTLLSYTGYREIWPKVPLALPDFADVINGQAAQTSTDPVEVARGELMYDYTTVAATPAGGQEGPAPAPGLGSLLFRVLPDALPSNGQIGVIATTEDADLARARAGTDGWWQAAPPYLGLNMSDGAQFIRILSATRMETYAGPLLLDRDLGIENWIKPVPNTSGTNSVLFAFNKPGGPQYMLGLAPDGRPFAGSRDVVSKCDTAIASNGVWTHLAASFRTDFGVQLGGARYLDAGNDRGLDTAEAVTVEAWVRLDKLGQRQIVASKWTPDGGKSWQLAVNEAGRLLFTVNQATATGEFARTEMSAGALAADGKWHHVAGVYDVAFTREVAIMFNAGSLVAIPQPANPPVNGVTIAMWVKTTGATKPGLQVLFTTVDPDGPLPLTLQLNNGIPEFRIWVGGNPLQRKATTALRAEDWIHIAASYNAADGILLAIDGIAVGASSGAVEDPAVSARDYWPERTALLEAAGPAAYTAGGHANGQASFTGAINEVSLWNRGLSIDAIRQKIRHPLAATEVGISGYWRFNDLFGTTVMDIVGTANGILKSGNFIRVDKGAFAQKLFIDGAMQSFSRVTDPIVLSDARILLGSGFFMDYLQGAIAETRAWKIGRMNWQINYFAARDLEPNAEGLIAVWSFGTGKGRIAFDSKGDNNAVIRDGEIELTDEAVDAMWIRTSFKAGWIFYVNGSVARSAPSTLDAVGYGDAQANIAALRVKESVARTYAGDINELRIWSGQLTGDQVRTSMYVPLTGAEAGLAAYWPINEGSAGVIGDRTGQGSNGQWIGPQENPPWQLSTAPVGQELPQIRSTPGGSSLPQAMRCASAPGAASYGQVFDRPDGGFVSSLLLAYATIDPSFALELYSGFKAGDLDLQYIGQAQLAPTVIGYIEGPPPVPAENLKVFPNSPGSYQACATVTLAETSSEAFTYTASRSVGTETSISTNVGFTVSSDTSAGIGVQTKVAAVTFDLGLSIKADETQSDDDEASLSEDSSVTARRYVEVNGNWVENTYDIDGGNGDLLFPNNFGYAQVRSGTADLFAMRLRGSGSIVGYTVRPNPDIPEDVNVIMFKLRPTYVKNGTLDGWIGFLPDIDYKNLQPGEHGSYFKPLEAYALKQQIAREQHQRRTWFDNFDSAGLGKREKAGKPGSIDVAERDRSLLNILIGLSAKSGLSPGEWKARIARRNMANTYVWTAEGGLYAEEQQFLAMREESTGGSYSLNAGVGVYTELSFNIGPSFALDAMFGSTIMTQVVKANRETAQVNMDVTVTGERYIGTMIPDDINEFDYTSTPSPGKVKAYRFMSFYLAPSKRNFDDLKNVIDEDWLNSTGPYLGQYNPDALALRRALNNPNEVWRLLHRVTYVSRVPPTTNNAGESTARDARRPDEISITNNLAMITALPTDPSAANPMVKVSIEADALLADLEENPVWGELLRHQAAAVKSDIMTYMRNYYGISSDR